jgi:signal transduction histidine kinase
VNSAQKANGNDGSPGDVGRRESLVSTALTACVDFEVFRRQESTIILLNLSIIAALLLVQVLFREALALPSLLIIMLFGARFLMQAVELIWLNTRARPLGWRVVCGYAHLSIVLHIAFATLVSMLSTSEDSHYTVLMILPVVAAAFRYSLSGTLSVASIAGALTILQVWVYFRSAANVNLSEYFEAVTMVLIYFAVGLVVWLLVAQLRREQGKVQSALHELEQTRDRLVSEEKLAAIGRLASAIAHEIRNPIAMISSSLSTAQQPGMEPELRDEMFDIAATEAHRLETFTTDFLAYARTAKPDKQPESLTTIAEYVGSLAKARAGEAGARVGTVCMGNGTAMVDAFQIQQAVVNLVLNAIDAAGQGGRIEIGCQAQNQDLEIYVQNTGKAIPEDIATRVFEPFYTTKPRGTGLGLAIARNIARGHGGELVLDCNEPDCIRFAMRLPDALAGPDANYAGAKT